MGLVVKFIGYLFVILICICVIISGCVNVTRFNIEKNININVTCYINEPISTTNQKIYDIPLGTDQIVHLIELKVGPKAGHGDFNELTGSARKFKNGHAAVDRDDESDRTVPRNDDLS